jgi:hypothetical protein
MAATTSEDFSGLRDDELWDLAARVADEQRRRAVESGDIDALCAEGFDRGFDAKGHARDPVVSSGLVVCYGSLVERSAMSHECRFANLGGDWVWEHPEVIHDEIRKLVERGRHHQRSVSVLPALEGLGIDLVSSTMRQGVHHMTQVRSFQVRGGALELVNARTVRTDRHR